MLEYIFNIVNPQTILIIGGLVTILGGYLVHWKSEKQKKEADKVISENLQLTREIADLSKAQKDLLQQNLEYAKIQKELSDKNLVLSEKNASLLRSSYNQITGGESFPYIEMGFWYKNSAVSEKLDLLIQNGGDTPIYDLSVEINEVVIVKNQPTNIGCDVYPIFKKQVGTLPKSISEVVLLNIELKERDKVYYEAKFQARNGDVEQHLILVKKDNKWTFGTKVYKFIKKENGAYNIELLKEEYSEGFPRDTVVWCNIY